MADLKQLVFQKGETIFSQGDAADCAYIIDSGIISVISTTDNVAEIIAEITEGGFLGEMAMLDDTPRSATAIAKTEVRLTLIEREQLQLRLKNADPVLASLLNVFINRLRHQLHLSPNVSNPAYDEMEGFNSLKFENEIKNGINAGDMRLYLQPIADINTREIKGFEALVRWLHPQQGLIRPDLFIKAAEDSGLIVPLGRWIVHEACRIAQYLENTPNTAGVYHQQAFISINISVRQFNDPEFFVHLEQALAESKINPKRVKLEVTESALSNMELAKQWIKKAKAFGVRISLDDFGTGYSSLSYLHEFDFDNLKIDQSFVRKMLHDEKSRKIVEVIMILAQKMSMEVIAEGVEEEEHIQMLKDLGCHLLQGYIIAKPMPLESYLIED